jgi:flavin-binding protein dodecin
MAKGSTYNIIELVGTSDKSWEEAAKLAVETAAGALVPKSWTM